MIIKFGIALILLWVCMWVMSFLLERCEKIENKFARELCWPIIGIAGILGIGKFIIFLFWFLK